MDLIEREMEERERLKCVPLSLQYLTNEARDTCRELGFKDLTLYDQCLLIEKCYNVNYTTVQRVLMAEKFGTKKNGMEPALLTNRQLIENFCPRGNIKETHHIQFTAKAMEMLFNIDRFWIYCDYTIVWEDLMPWLNNPYLTKDAVQELANRYGQMSMNIVTFKIKEYCYMADRNFKELGQLSSYKIESYPPTSAETIERLTKLSEELKSVTELEKRYGLN